MVRKGNLSKLIKERKIPLMCWFELTNLCNHECIHCCRDRDTENELSAKEIKDILDQLKDTGCMQLIFTGGEPLVRKDFFEIAEYAKKGEFSIILYTNGFLVPENIDRLKKLPIRRVETSLYGATETIHEKITGVKHSFDNVLKAIELLRKAGIPVLVKTLIMKENLKEIEKIKSLCRSLNLNYMIDPLVLPRFDGNKPSPQRYAIDREQLERLKERDIFGVPDGEALRARLGGNVEKLYDLSMRVAVSSRGIVYPSIILRMKAGDLRKQRFADIWNFSPLFRYLHSLTINDFAECAKCKYLDFCPLCVGFSYLENGELLQPSPQVCNFIDVLYKGIRHEEKISQRQENSYEEKICQGSVN